jgi:hypothetical protein
MADNISNTIAGILTQARDEIRANMQTQNINASGRTSAALQVRQNGSRIELVKVAGENAPFQTLQYGRAGGKVPAGFYYIIKQWTRDKGLSFNNETERGTFSYFVARKIAREGTNRHKTPNTQVYSEPIKKAVESLRKDVRRYILQGVQTTINSNFK